MELHLASAGTVVRFVTDELAKNYPLVFCHWEASPCYNYSALLYACDAHDIAVTGDGVLDGGADAEHWWSWHHQVERSWSENKPDLQQPARKALRDMNLNGVPVEERIFGEGHCLPAHPLPAGAAAGRHLPEQPHVAAQPHPLQERGGGRCDPVEPRSQQRRLRP